MRTATAALQTLITALYNGAQFQVVYADLWTFTGADGTVLGRYTNADIDLQVNLDGSGGGATYFSNGPLLIRKNVRFTIGVEVNQMELTMVASSAIQTFQGVPWMQALRNGAMRGGRVNLYRFVSDAWTNTAVGAVNWFSGRIGPMEIGRSQAKIMVNSDMVLLNVQMPRELQGPPCANVLYDVKCTMAAASFKQSGTVVASGSTLTTINTASLSQATPYWVLGKIKFTSGVNSGTWATIRQQPGTNQIVLVAPLNQLCGNGDTFDIYAGCDHTQATCVAKFNNVINFRGAPYTPTPEMIL